MRVGNRYKVGPLTYEVTHVDKERGMALTYFGVKGTTAWVSIANLLVYGVPVYETEAAVSTETYHPEGMYSNERKRGS